jgi:hypothetical protein
VCHLQRIPLLSNENDQTTAVVVTVYIRDVNVWHEYLKRQNRIFL